MFSTTQSLYKNKNDVAERCPEQNFKIENHNFYKLNLTIPPVFIIVISVVNGRGDILFKDYAIKQ